METDWTIVYCDWHDVALQQAEKVKEILKVCERDEPPSMLLQAINEIAVELTLHRSMFGAIRMGIARGHLTGAEATA